MFSFGSFFFYQYLPWRTFEVSFDDVSQCQPFGHLFLFIEFFYIAVRPSRRVQCIRESLGHCWPVDIHNSWTGSSV